jgi:hypothetical protein
MRTSGGFQKLWIFYFYHDKKDDLWYSRDTITIDTHYGPSLCPSWIAREEQIGTHDEQ